MLNEVPTQCGIGLSDGAANDYSCRLDDPYRIDRSVGVNGSNVAVATRAGFGPSLGWRMIPGKPVRFVRNVCSRVMLALSHVAKGW